MRISQAKHARIFIKQITNVVGNNKNFKDPNTDLIYT